MVAPRIVHGGAVRVNGSAAYVAGEQVQLRVNQGLFDIIVDTGSDNATPLVHTGSTGGPASTGAGDVHAHLHGRGAQEPGDHRHPAGQCRLRSGGRRRRSRMARSCCRPGFNVVGGQVDRYGDFGPAPEAGRRRELRDQRRHDHAPISSAIAVTDMLASGAGDRQPRLPAGRQPVRRPPRASVRRRRPERHASAAMRSSRRRGSHSADPTHRSI